MLTEEQLREALKDFFQENADITKHTFMVQEGDKIRIGAYDPEEGWYAEVSNFQHPPAPNDFADYCDKDEHVEGLFRFFSYVKEAPITNNFIQEFMEQAAKDAELSLSLAA